MSTTSPVQHQTLVGGFAADVARDLQRPQKQLQSQYLYDPLGSSLFDAICRLPWYRITRAEAGLLAAHAREIAARAAGAPPAALAIVELGVGSGEKLATIVEAAAGTAPLAVHLIDISNAALDATASRLAGFSHVTVARHQATYEAGLARAAAAIVASQRTLLLFLGSNIGNFDEDAAPPLLGSMRQSLRAGDLLLLGTDLVKPERDLILAYDDPLGVTAAFNKNLLVRINRELGGTFDVAAFDHRAIWNPERQRVEMHLVSRRRQEVSIPAADLTVSFAAGESIWTESSYKYTEEAVAELGRVSGFSTIEQWVDADARFALTLLTAV
jgi:dimethylhistidine N-methyltransferase